jgi:hypothetical protein
VIVCIAALGGCSSAPALTAPVKLSAASSSAAGPAQTGPAQTGPAHASAAAPPVWQEESLPQAVSLGVSLYAGAAVSADDAWAVGGLSGNEGQIPLILHYNGKAWSRAATTGISDSAGELGAVVATRTEVWVSTDLAGETAYIYRRSGSAWVRVPLPAGVTFPSIAAGPDGQVWAIGDTATKVARWTGSAWQVYSTGISSGDNGNQPQISALSFTSSSNGWAVGTDVAGPLVLRWNGTRWTKAPAPAPPAGPGYDGGLTAVLATASAGAWVIGVNIYGTTGYWLEHWNGKTWANAALPAGFGQPNVDSISAGAKSGQPQWISADSSGATSSYLHYSAGAWTLVPGANGGSVTGFSMVRLVSIPGTNATWAIGIGSSPPEVFSGGPVPTARIEYAP